MGNLQEREQEKSLHGKKLAVRPIPNVGEKVFACVPPFRISCLMPAEGSSVMQKPTEFFTARTLWKPENEAKYVEAFAKLEKEKKVVCIGKINRRLEVELSDSGHAFLMEMDKKYEW